MPEKMTALELCDHLADLVAKYGDLECVDSYSDPIVKPEEIEGKFVLAEKA